MNSCKGNFALGVNRVGFIDPEGQNKTATLNGVISNPFAAALNSFLDNRLCELAEKAESYYRSIGLDALANIVYANRAAAGCTIAPPGGFVSTPPTPPYTGGQCPNVEYLADAVITNPFNNVINTTVRFTQGPVRSVFADSNASGNSVLRYIGGVPEQERVASTFVQFGSAGRPYSLASIGNFRRTDGQPDNCGNSTDGDPPVYPVEVDLPPPPAPDEELIPPESVTVQIEVDGVPEDLEVEVDNVTVDPVNGVCLTLFGTRVCVRPDFSVTMDDLNDPGPAPTVEEIADELEEAINPVIAGSVGAQLCDGTVVDFPYSGNGIEGVADKLGAVVDSLLAVNAEQCPIEEEEETLGSRVLISSGTVSGLDVINVPIDNQVRRIYVQLGAPTAGMRVFRLSGEESEANFGSFSLSFLSEGARYIDDWTLFYTRRRLIEFNPRESLSAFLRLSLKDGLSYSVHVQRIS